LSVKTFFHKCDLVVFFSNFRHSGHFFNKYSQAPARLLARLWWWEGSESIFVIPAEAGI